LELTRQHDEYLFAYIKENLKREDLTEQMRRTLLVLLVDLQTAYNHIQVGRDQWLFALDAVHSPVFLIDSKFRVVRANLDYAKHAGMDIREVIGKPYWQVFPRMDGPSESFCRCMREHEEVVDELQLPDGQVFLDHGYTVFDDEDKPYYSLHMLEDITERMKMESQLRLFRKLIDSSNDAVEVMDPVTMQFIDINDTACRHLGYGRDELLSMKVCDIDPNFSTALMDKVDEQTRDSGSAVFETVHRRKDGSEFPVEVSLTFIDIDKRYILSIVRDITARKNAEKAVELSEARLKEAQQIARLGSWELDLGKNVLWMSDVVYEIFGVKPGVKINYEAFLRAVHPDDRETVDMQYNKSIAVRKPLNIDFRIRLRDGSIKWISGNSKTHYDKNGKPLRSIGTLLDITERMTAAETMKALNRTLLTLRLINQALVRSGSEDELIKAVCKILVDEGGYSFTWVGYAEHDVRKSVRPVSWAGEGGEYLDDITISWGDEEYGLAATGTAIRTCLPVVVNDIVKSTGNSPWRKHALKHGFGSFVTLPLNDDNGCFGALSIYAVEANAFDDESQVLLAEMAGDLAFGITSLRNRKESAERDRQMRNLIEHNPDAILTLDSNGHIEYSNPAAQSMFGQAAKSLQGVELGLPATNGEITEIEVLLYGRDGAASSRSAEMRLVNIGESSEGKILAFLHDVTETKRAENLKSRMGSILEHSWNEIYVFSEDTLMFVDASTGAIQHLGYRLDELLHMTPMNLTPDFSREQFEALLEPLRKGQEREINFETDVRCKDGTQYPVEVRLQLSWEEYHPVFIAIVQDISERKRYISELEEKALYDSLTGLPNRALLYDRLDQALRHAQRATRSITVLSISVLRLNEINDLMGYQSGDEVLKEIAQRLTSVCRDSDTVARLGDNEFVIQIDQAGPDSGQIVATKIQKSLETPVRIGDVSLEIEPVIGIAIYPDHGDDTYTLLQHCDIAMRMAKQDGLGILVYNHEIDPLSLRQLRLHGELRQAIEKGNLVLHYQPKVDIKTGCIMGVEALARWPHPLEGVIYPDDFIPMIEQSGLIRPFTYWVLQQALKLLQQWKNNGIDFSVAVNLSTRNLLDPDLPATVSGLLESHQVDVDKLCLEVTESALMSRPEQSLLTMNQLRETGVKISIDDFGTGYSSLAYLKKLPVSEIKIDKSFVLGLTEDEGDAAIVRSTIDLAHNLDLETVAEGVESKDIMEALKGLGCDIAQGYYISRPLPEVGLQDFVENSSWGLHGGRLSAN
jgi:diguanylate cyclase (GGDEF)-like protein/PAS domain S-box-containing protein